MADDVTVTMEIRAIDPGILSNGDVIRHSIGEEIVLFASITTRDGAGRITCREDLRNVTTTLHGDVNPFAWSQITADHGSYSEDIDLHSNPLRFCAFAPGTLEVTMRGIGCGRDDVTASVTVEILGSAKGICISELADRPRFVGRSVVFSPNDERDLIAEIQNVENTSGNVADYGILPVGEACLFEADVVNPATGRVDWARHVVAYSGDVLDDFSGGVIVGLHENVRQGDVISITFSRPNMIDIAEYWETLSRDRYDIRRYDYSERFCFYLMYRSKREGSNWVALSRYVWEVEARLVYDRSLPSPHWAMATGEIVQVEEAELHENPCYRQSRSSKRRATYGPRFVPPQTFYCYKEVRTAASNT